MLGTFSKSFWFSRFSSVAMIGTAAAAASLLSSGANAGIVNAGFEDPIQNVDSWDYTASGWVAVGDAGVFRPTAASYFGGAYSGEQVGFVQSGWVYSTGTLQQTTDDVIVAGETYAFSTMAGRRLDNPLLPWQGFTMSIYAGSMLLASVDTPVDPGLGDWQRATLQYTAEVGSAGVGQNVTVRLTSAYGQTNFDDVSFGLVPSPGATSVLAIAAVLVYKRAGVAISERE